MSEAGAPESPDGETRSITVLYVEDNQQTGPLVREWLERHDSRMDVTLAVNLDEARDALDQSSFDAVVADYRFPSGKGLDLVGRAREGAPELPFLIYSARVTEEVEQEADDAGVTAVVEKGGSDQLSLLAEYIVEGAQANATATADATDDDHVDEFVDDLVHDIRGPLSVAQAHLDLLDADPERTERLRETLERVEDVVEEVPERAAALREQQGQRND